MVPAWKLSILRPVGLSVGAITGFSLLLGLFFLPHEVAHLRQPYTVSIQQLVFDDQQRITFVFCKCSPRQGERPLLYQLSRQPLDQPTLDPHVMDDVPRPTCVAPVAGGVIVGEDDGTIRRHGDATGAGLVIGRQPEGRVGGLACSPDERLLLSWGNEYCLWDLTTNRLLSRGPRDFLFALIPADAQGFYCYRHGEIVECELLTGKQRRVVARPGYAIAAALSPDRRHLATIGYDNKVQVTDLDSGALVWERSVGGPDSPSQLPIPNALPVLVYSPSGDRFVCAHDLDQRRSWGVSVWNAVSGQVEQTFQAHAERIVGARFVGPRRLYTWGRDSLLKKWDLSPPQVRQEGQWNTANWRMRDE